IAAWPSVPSAKESASIPSPLRCWQRGSASARLMATEQETPFRLDEEQRARVGDCLKKEALSLPADCLERFIGSIEASIAHFRATPAEGSFRDAHDALRALRALADEDDPPIGQLKARLARLPAAARKYIGRRAPIVMRRLGVDLGSPAGE